MYGYQGMPRLLKGHASIDPEVDTFTVLDERATVSREFAARSSGFCMKRGE
jgi:hypothetical protein